MQDELDLIQIRDNIEIRLRAQTLGYIHKVEAASVLKTHLRPVLLPTWPLPKFRQLLKQR